MTGVSRNNELLDGSRQETSAEHSWHVALCAIVLAPAFAPEVDLGRVLKMLAIHDAPEIHVGDVRIYDAAERAAIVALEREAARRMFGTLPEGCELVSLWEEFEDGLTDEARFAKAVDRLQPMLIHWAGDGRVWRQQRIQARQLQELLRILEGLWPPLAPTARAIIKDAVRRGDLAPSAQDRLEADNGPT